MSVRVCVVSYVFGYVHVLVQAIAAASTSIALFAPAWTYECRGANRHDAYDRAEMKFWMGQDWKGEGM